MKSIIEKLKKILKKCQEISLSIFFAKIIIIFAFLILAIFLIVVYANVAKYSIIVSDDYIHHHQVVSLDTYIEGKNLHNALEYAKWDCLNLGGRYTTMFMQSFFGIKQGINYMKQQSCYMVFNCLGYFISLFYVIFSMVSNVILHKNKLVDKIMLALIIFVSFIYVFNGFNYYPEIFSWFSGANSYTIPLIFFFISFGTLLYVLNNKNMLLIIISFLFAIISMGGSLSIVAVILVIVSISLIIFLIDKKINFTFFLLLLQYYIFGFLNVISPGNFNRRNLLGANEISIMESFNNIHKYLDAEFLTLFSKPYLLFSIIVLGGIIAICVCYYSNFSFSYYILSILILLLPIATAIPITVGFGNDLFYAKANMYSRISFIIDFSIIICAINLSIVCYSIIYILLINVVKDSKKICAVIIIILCICVANYIVNDKYKKEFNDVHCIAMVDDLYNNKYKEYYDFYENIIMKKLEKNRNSEIVELPKAKDDLKHFFNFFITSDRGQKEFFNIKEIIYEGNVN